MWPKHTDFFLHGDKEQNLDDGRRLGLSEEANRNIFRGTGYEVEFRLAVNEDGSNKVLSINGIDVSDKGISI